MWNRRKFLVSATATVAAIGLGGFGMVDATDPGLPFSFRVSGYKILTNIPDAQQPWRSKTAPYVDSGLHDAAGVRKFKWNGVIYDHPVAQIQYGLQNLASYRKTGDIFYLNRCRVQAERLITNSKTLRGAKWYPYPFDWTHTVHSGLAFKAPWYSGMAQGEALSLFSQLAQHPSVSLYNRARYRDMADKTFKSLLLNNSSNPWVVEKSIGYLWIQEYPVRYPGRSDFTYNGFMYAMLGIWDYYKMTGNPLAAKLWDGSLTTINQYFPHLRNPGGVSFYCYTHKIPATNYHSVHIALLNQLTTLSGNPRFAVYASQLAGDYP